MSVAEDCTWPVVTEQLALQGLLKDSTGTFEGVTLLPFPVALGRAESPQKLYSSAADL